MQSTIFGENTSNVAPAPRSENRLWSALGVLLAVAVLGAGLVLASTSFVASTGYNLDRLQARKAYLEGQTQELEAEVASLRSLERIEREARSRLKMVNATSYVYVTVDAVPEHPTVLLKRALNTRQPAPATPERHWWEVLSLVFAPFRKS